MTGTFSLPTVLKIPSLSSSSNPNLLSAARMSCGSTSAEAKTVKVRVKGVVQGVFYRKWTVENAQQLGVKGWVRNRRDGSVEAVVKGDPKAVDEMVERCKRGPPAAVVTAVNVTPADETSVGETFELKSTQ